MIPTDDIKSILMLETDAFNLTYQTFSLCVSSYFILSFRK